MLLLKILAMVFVNYGSNLPCPSLCPTTGFCLPTCFGLTVPFHPDSLIALLYRHNLAKQDYKIDMIKSNNGIIMKQASKEKFKLLVDVIFILKTECLIYGYFSMPVGPRAY